MQYDATVIISGGGMASLALAAALGQQNIPVIIIEKSRLDKLAQEPDGRALAITPAARYFMIRLGAWQYMRPRGVIEEIRVSDNHAPRFLHFDALDNDQPMGHIIESHLVRAALTTIVKRHSSIKIIENATIEQCDFEELNHVQVRLSDGRTFTSQLVVGAEGRGSFLRNLARIKLTKFDYGQTAFVCNIHQSLPHHNIAIELFRDSGPFALLPLEDPHKGGIVFCAFNRDGQRLKAMSDTEFEAKLNHISQGIIGDIKLASDRWSFPLSWQWAHEMVKGRLALVGDAAHGMHPIAGQGINMGFRDSAELAEQIIAAHQNGDDAGGASYLSAYQKARRADNMQMMLATDALVRLFCSKLPFVSNARQFGLFMMNKLPFVKNTFVHQAMGVKSSLPGFMQPIGE